MLTPGEIFKKRRLQLRKTLNTVSQETKIQEKYIEALENNNYQSFNSPVFASGFVKLYSDYLNLDVEKMSAIYRRSYTQENVKTKDVKNRFDFKGLAKKYLTPLSVITVAVLILVIGFLVYFNRQLKDVDLQPKIEISSPNDNATINQPQIELKGYTNKGYILKVNEGEVVNNNGSFSTQITLKEGSNIVTIQATDPKDPNLKATKVITVNYQKETTTTPEQPIVTSYNVYIEVLKEPAWIELSIDGQWKLKQILPVGKTITYDVTKSFEIISGKPTTTKVYINKTQKSLKIDTVKHTAFLNCRVESSQLNCD